MDSGSLLELLGDLGGDSVHVGCSLLGQGLSVCGAGALVVLVRDLANKTGFLEFNEAVSDALSGSESVVLGVGTVVLVS